MQFFKQISIIYVRVSNLSIQYTIGVNLWMFQMKLTKRKNEMKRYVKASFDLLYYWLFFEINIAVAFFPFLQDIFYRFLYVVQGAICLYLM